MNVESGDAEEMAEVEKQKVRKRAGLDGGGE